MEYKYAETHEIRCCEVCNTEFECRKSSKKRFCTIQCQGKWQSTQVGELNPRIKRTWVKCDYCHKDILVKNYKLETNQHNFCNEKCRQSWYAEIWSQRPEWKQKKREIAISLIEMGIFSRVDSKPQQIIDDILKSLRIDFIKEYNIKYYAVDNYLQYTGLMIEVMGDYWHSNPLLFSQEQLNKTQKERIGKDKAKHSYIKNHYNVEVLYLWENDIVSNPLLCRDLIMLYVWRGGSLENYNSFNYLYKDGELILKDTLIHSYCEQNAA